MASGQRLEDRVGWIDSWKGLLIFLVVLGHVVGALAHYTTVAAHTTMVAAYKAIYLFHMPAFFVIVGVVDGLRGAEDRVPFGSFVKKRARRLLVPYVVWGLVSVVAFWFSTALLGCLGVGATDGYYRIAMADGSWWRPFLSLLHAGGWPNGEGFRCNSVLWFLPCMFMTLCAYWPTRGLCGWKTGGLILGLLVLGGLMRFSVGPLPWGLDRVPRFLAFVLLGRLFGGVVAKVFDVVWLKLLPTLVGYLVVVWWFPDLSWCWQGWDGYLTEMAMALFGSFAALLLARACDGRLLRTLGVVSLGIMLVHKFPLVALQLVLARFLSAESTAFLGSAWGTTLLAMGSAVLVTAVAWLFVRLTRKCLF